MTPEKPTPETDFEEAAQTQRFGGYMVKADFARRLERERDAAIEKVMQAEEDFQKIINSVPCGVNGFWFYPAFSGDGDYIGETPTSPESAMQEMHTIAEAALDKLRNTTKP